MSVTAEEILSTCRNYDACFSVADVYRPDHRWGVFLERSGTFVGKSRLVDPKLDSAAGGRPNFLTTQWGLVVAASTEGTAEARIASRNFIAFIAIRFTP
jgi:hypothetical protein